MIIDLQTYTAIHTALSVIALAAGALVLVAMLRRPGETRRDALFLATAGLTSVTGFGFPFVHFLPSHAVGIVALLVLALVLVARHFAHLAGHWRTIYSIGIVASVYFLVFVAIAQAFAKIPALHRTAPTLSEAPFVVVQLVTLAGFVALGVVVWRSLVRR